jgi:hypothetical protein
MNECDTYRQCDDTAVILWTTYLERSLRKRSLGTPEMFKPVRQECKYQGMVV